MLLMQKFVGKFLVDVAMYAAEKAGMGDSLYQMVGQQFDTIATSALTKGWHF